jgi:hypothetical protein
MSSDNTVSRSRWFRTTCVFVGGTLVGAILTGFVTDFFSFRSEKRAELIQAQSEAQKAAKDLITTLVPVSDFATAKTKNLDKKVVNDLRDKVLVLHQDASGVVALLPALKPQFEEYSEALVQLQSAVSLMDGPYTSKKFVQATDEFLVKKEAFDQRFNSLTSSYIDSIAPSS